MAWQRWRAREAEALIAALLTIIVLTVTGLPFAIALHPDADRSAQCGEAFLIGCGWIPIVMFALSSLHIRWMLPTILACAAIPPLFLLRGTKRAATSATRWTPLDLVTALLIVAYALYATRGPMGAWDFWAIYGVKARAFFDHGGIDWRMLASPLNRYVNPDYPLGLPLLFDLDAILNGAWDDRSTGLLYPAFTIALVLIARPLLEKESDSPAIVSAMTLTIAALSFTQRVGTADAPLVAISAAALLTLRRGIADDDHSLIRTASILLGVAAFMKNEGIAMVAAAAIGVAVATRSWKRVVALWPAAACAASWLVVVRLFGLKSQFLQIAPHLRQLPIILRTIAANRPEHPLFWIAALLAIALAFREMKRELLLATFIIVQLAFYVWAYVVTSLPVIWQINNSWQRLLTHVAIPLACLAFAASQRFMNGNSASRFARMFSASPTAISSSSS